MCVNRTIIITCKTWNYLTVCKKRNHHHHHHHVALPALISLTLSRHPSLSSIAPGRFSCIGTELLYIGSRWSSNLWLSIWRGPLEYIAYELVLNSPAVSRMYGWLTLKVFVMGGRWPYNCCFVRCFNITCSILAFLPSNFFFIRLIRVHVVHPYSSMDTTVSWKKYILFYRSVLTSIWPIASL